MTRRWIGWVGLLATLTSSCSNVPAPLVETEAPSVGTELYLMLCEHVSGTLYPNDVRGRMTRRVCKNGEPDPEGRTRLEAMRQNRERIVTALDAVFAPEAYKEDELTGFLRALIPLFDAPGEALPKATDALADVLDSIRADDTALTAIARTSGREGIRPLASALGATAAVLRTPNLQQLLRALSTEIEPGGVANEAWQQLIAALGMELAVYAPADDDVSSLDVTSALLLATDEAFAGPVPMWLARRDSRGFARPAGSAGVVDANGDGAWDVDAQGRFVDVQGRPLSLPPPLATLTEAERAVMSVARDGDGLALDASGTRLYEYLRADHTLLSGLARELSSWSQADEAGNIALFGLSKGLSALLGPMREHQAAFGSASLAYQGHDTALSPLARMLDAAALLIELPELAPGLSAFERVLTEHEGVAARFAKAMLAAKARSDREESAQIAHPSTFWDEVLTLLKRLAQRRTTPDLVATADDASALESLLRALAKPEMRGLGGQIAMLGRYNTYCQNTAQQTTSACVDLDASDINGAVRGGYATKIDRALGDLPAHAADNDPGNTSQLQAFLGLIGELMDRKLCSKATSATALFQAMASDKCDDYPLKGFMAGSAGVIGTLLGDLEECGFIALPDMGRAFGQAMMNRTAAQIAAGNPELAQREREHGLDLLKYINNDTMAALLSAGASIGLTLDSMRGLFDNIFRACSGVSEFDTTPSGSALARVLFAPEGSKTQVFADTMFPPATVRPYLSGTTRDFDPVDGKPDFDVNRPPANLKLSHAFAGALSVWEIPWQFGTAPPSSLMTSIAPMTYALNEHDFFPHGDAAAEAKGAPYFDSDQYLLNPLIGAFAKHYASEASGRQNQDPGKPYYSTLSNLRSYEGLLVDMLGEPGVVANAYLSQEQVDFLNAQENIGLFSALNDLLATLDGMTLEGGADGIDVVSALAERVLDPHAYCAPDAVGYVTLGSLAPDGTRRLDGKGACDCDRDGDGTLDAGAPLACTASATLALRKPLRMRGVERDFVEWEDGQKFDGTGAEAPFRALAPIDVLLFSLAQIDELLDAQPDAKSGFRGARSAIMDTLFETTTLDNGELKFANGHTLPLLRITLNWAKEQLERHRAAPATDPSGKPLNDSERERLARESLRAWASQLPARGEAFVSSPVPAASLRFMSDVQRNEALRGAFATFLGHAFDVDAAPDSFGPLMSSLVDALQLLQDGETLPPILRAASRALVPNVDAVLSTGAEHHEPAPLDAIMTFVHKALQADEAGTLATILARLVALHPAYLQGKAAPLDALSEALAQVQRAEPGATEVFDRADVAELLAQISDFLRDDRRGMTRMVEIVQHRSLAPAAGAGN